MSFLYLNYENVDQISVIFTQPPLKAFKVSFRIDSVLLNEKGLKITIYFIFCEIHDEYSKERLIFSIFHFSVFFSKDNFLEFLNNNMPNCGICSNGMAKRFQKKQEKLTTHSSAPFIIFLPKSVYNIKSPRNSSKDKNKRKSI